MSKCVVTNLNFKCTFEWRFPFVASNSFGWPHCQFSICKKWKRKFQISPKMEKMEGNAYGILSYDKSLATFLGAFVETNHDNLDSMLAHVIAEHKVLSLIFQLNYSFSFSFRNYIFYYIWSNTLCKAGSNMKLYWFFLSAVVMNTEFYWPQVYFEPSKPSKMDSMCAYTYVCVYVCAAV